jgi:hypothetical protein
MHASHERRGPGGTHFNQDQRASGTGLPITLNPSLKLLWDHQAFAKRVTSPRTPTTTTHVQTIASVLGEKYAKVDQPAPVGAGLTPRLPSPEDPVKGSSRPRRNPSPT